MKADVSFLMSLYCRERADYLNWALESVNNQSIAPKQIVLVIDGAIGEDLELVVQYWVGILPLTIVRLEKNVGLSKALNIGLNYCEYELVARFDTDDLCHSDRIRKQFEYMSHNAEVDVCGTWAHDIDNEGNIIGDRIVPCEKNTIKRLIWSCPMIHPSVMFRKSSIVSIGSYNPEAPHRQDDYDLWLRCIEANLTLSNLDEFLVYYRYPIGSESKNTFSVGFNRFKLGYKSLLKYDARLFSVLALMYPMVRSLMPNAIKKRLISLANKFDPRLP